MYSLGLTWCSSKINIVYLDVLTLKLAINPCKSIHWRRNKISFGNLSLISSFVFFFFRVVLRSHWSLSMLNSVVQRCEKASDMSIFLFLYREVMFWSLIGLTQTRDVISQVRVHQVWTFQHCELWFPLYVHVNGEDAVTFSLMLILMLLLSYISNTSTQLLPWL